MLNGTSVPYATVKLNVFEFVPNTSVIYLGHTTDKPSQMLERSGNVLQEIPEKSLLSLTNVTTSA